MYNLPPAGARLHLRVYMRLSSAALCDAAEIIHYWAEIAEMRDYRLLLLQRHQVNTPDAGDQ